MMILAIALTVACLMLPALVYLVSGMSERDMEKIMDRERTERPYVS